MGRSEYLVSRLPARSTADLHVLPVTASGFTYRITRQGDVFIDHHGRHAATLRGQAATRFVTRVTGANEEEAQLAMAKVTGNYKRGNERR